MYPVFVIAAYVSVFFFSSRRRHTRWNCDWSSDVCSSDLLAEALGVGQNVVSKVLARLVAAGVIEVGRRHVRGEPQQIGRASCRERGETSGVAGGWKKKTWWT